MKILFVWPNKDSFGYKPINISVLSGIARRLGCDTGLFDTTGIDFGYADNSSSGEEAKIYKPVDFSKYNLKKRALDLESAFTRTLEEFSPDCIAISVLSDEFQIASRINSIAKKRFSGIPVIWGGKFPTLKPAETLELYNADFACLGEGLDAFADFIEALAGKKDIYNIKNIWARKNGNIIRNEVRPLKPDLDDLPFVDWEIFDKRQFYKPFDGKAYIGGDHMLNWGCPYHCTYCINSYYQKLYDNKHFLRRYGTKRIIEELKFLKSRYAIEFFKYHDEDFLMRPVENLKELSSAYRDSVNLPFVIETNPRSVTKEKVGLLKEMNCVSATMGIECGDDDMRKNVLKRVDTEEDIIRAFSLFRDAGIRTSSFNLLGIPFETRDSYEKTVKINRVCGVQYPDIGFFYPFEKTELRDISIENGFFDPADEGSMVYKRDVPALRFKDLSAGELIEMRKAFVLYVKLPETYGPYIKRSEQSDAKGKALRKKILEIYDDTVWKNNGWYRDDGRYNLHMEELDAIMNGRKACGHESH